MSGPKTAPLTAALEAALLRELADVHRTENWLHFASRLAPPIVALSDSTARLGRWIGATRTIELSRALVLDRPWPDVVSVLQHEMAHQYVDEVLGVRDESAHGAAFRQVCAERGIDGAAAGAPAAPAGATPAADRVLERIRKLLALAGSANQHEAESAMQRAHELMLRHNIEVAAAAEARDFEVRHVGDPLRRSNAVEAAILVLLGDCFFVRVIRLPVYLPREGKRGSVYELTGTRANLELALHVYEFLLGTAERLWRENRTDARVRSGRDRLAYQHGVIRGFHDKLRLERVVLAGTGLVWRGDARLDEHYQRRHPRTHSSRRTVRTGGAHSAGREAGHKVVLHRPVAGGPGPSRRLLGGGG
jgi:hypothetical protein